MNHVLSDDKPQGVVDQKSLRGVTANSSTRHVPDMHRLSVFNGDENRPFGIIFEEGMENLRKAKQVAISANTGA
jgi:hypothetical protein